MKLKTEDRMSLTAGLHDQFSITSFITDILYQNHTVIICLLPSSDIPALKDYLLTVISEPGSFEIGPAVNSLSEIKNSYQASLERDRNSEEPPKSPVLREGKQEKQKKTKNTEADARVFRGKVLQYVQEQFNNPQLSQIGVADHFGISIYSLSRLFNNDIGVGFAEFIAAKRMEQARTLLLSTGKDIMEIAAAVGITNANYFSRLFKYYFGIIPSRYRAEAGQNR
jgi:AraC-like DNA-binding protein